MLVMFYKAGEKCTTCKKMLDSYVSYIIYGLYILGGLSLVVSILTYVYLPQALKTVLEEDSEDNTDS